MKMLVLIHGAYHGGWCWKKTVTRLAGKGLRALTPTLTGLGERCHLLAEDTSLSTHIVDIVNLLKFEDLHQVILVGHSYAGMVISGVAEIMPERIARLVYLDAVVPRHGQTMFDILPGTRARVTETIYAGRRIKVITPPPPQAYGVTEPADVAWVTARLTPMPYACYAEPVRLTNPKAAELLKTYWLCEIQTGGNLQNVHAEAYAQAVGPHWSRAVITGPHDAMITHPTELAEQLAELTTE